MKLYYIIKDGQDGSASVSFFKTREEAEAADATYEKDWGMQTLSEGVSSIDTETIK